MTHLTANDLEAFYRPPTRARDWAARLWRHCRSYGTAMAREVRRCAQRSAGRPLQSADTLKRQFRRDILRIEARRML